MILFKAAKVYCSLNFYEGFPRLRKVLKKISWIPTKGRRQKKTVKWVTSYIFQITPSLLTIRMTTERMTNHNNQWVPPSLTKEWQINVLKRFQRGKRDLQFGWFYSDIFHFLWNKEWGMRFGQKREFCFKKSSYLLNKKNHDMYSWPPPFLQICNSF